MRIAIVALSLICMFSACKENDNNEIYNENNTSVADGVVYNIDEKPINGLYKTYYPNGNIKMAVYSHNGKPNGSGKFYTERGKLAYEGTFADGVLVGSMYQYYHNGKVHNELHYTDGQLDGVQRVYDKKGELSVEVIINNGKAISGFAVVNGEKREFTAEELEKFTL